MRPAPPTRLSHRSPTVMNIGRICGLGPICCAGGADRHRAPWPAQQKKGTSGGPTVPCSAGVDACEGRSNFFSATSVTSPAARVRHRISSPLSPPLLSVQPQPAGVGDCPNETVCRSAWYQIVRGSRPVKVASAISQGRAFSPGGPAPPPTGRTRRRRADNGHRRRIPPAPADNPETRG